MASEVEAGANGPVQAYRRGGLLAWGPSGGQGEGGGGGCFVACALWAHLINATLQLEQPLGDGTRTVGTGFLVNAPTPDGKPRTVLVTAGHVLDRMPIATAKIGYRVQQQDGGWRYDPRPLTIREGDGKPDWTRHP